MTRNTASVLLIGLAGLRLGATLTARRAGGTAADTRLWSGAARGPEVVLLVAGSVVAHGLTFGVADGLPLAFTLIVLTVWVGARFDTTFAALHDLVVAVAAVLLTLQGSGPFAAVESDALRALVVQAFIVVTAVTGLSLGLMRDERDALLRRVQDAARRDGEQAALLSAIVDTLHEGLLALDVDGRVVVRNAAARHLLGAAVEDPERLADPSSYGLSHLDGRPLTRHESAVSRALSGERVDGERVLVGAEGTPERRVLDVNAAPLPTAGEGHGAVVVFHDVTAQHAQQADLAAFAGVVAHDLRTPLTALDGWVELAEDTVHDDLPPGPAQEALAAALARARGSSRRMRTLIEDLLADATARDTAARRARVRTAALVGEVIAARGGPPRDGSPAPRFHVGQLPDVLADPVLLRQVLDNLVGNAVKYVAPGSVPDVTVTGRALPADRVELTVADRGIGIPAGQHEAVFGEFHRAHAGAGYAGTGIGLALCRRIVERHGGTITAQPNPGGGTCVSVVLPAPSAARSAPAAGRQAPAGSRR
jgi:signal transduction histidine kinase